MLVNAGLKCPQNRTGNSINAFFPVGEPCRKRELRKTGAFTNYLDFSVNAAVEIKRLDRNVGVARISVRLKVFSEMALCQCEPSQRAWARASLTDHVWRFL